RWPRFSCSWEGAEKSTLRKKVLLGIEKFNNKRSRLGRKMNIERSTISVLSLGGISLASVSLSLGRQLRHPYKVIRRPYPPSRQLRSLGSPISRFPKSTHCLGPAENLD